jgi:hypothetical protein
MGNTDMSQNLLEKLEREIVAKNPAGVFATLNDIFFAPERVIIDERFLTLARDSGNRSIERVIEVWAGATKTRAVISVPIEKPEIKTEPIQLQPGQKMPDGTIYLGKYTPKDRAGNSLRQTFNVFAAPEDLPETMTYDNTVKHIAGLKNFHGYDGTNYANDSELYAAIKRGSYKGGWIIPPRDILRGNDVNGKATTPDNLYAHKNTGALKGTFNEAAGGGPDRPRWRYWYCSSTALRDNSSYVHYVRFSDGIEICFHKDLIHLSCRPVRLVAASRTPAPWWRLRRSR